MGQFGGIGGDGHAVLDRSGAGREQTIGALDFHDAEAAGTDGGETFKVAQGGDIFAGSPGGLQDGLALESADKLAVDADGDFFLRQGRLLSFS